MGMISAMEVAKITSQPFQNVVDKSVAVCSSILNFSESIINIAKLQKKEKYLKRINYESRLR